MLAIQNAEFRIQTLCDCYRFCDIYCKATLDTPRIHR